MHFFYGVGAFFTPMIVKSFLNMDITFTSSSLNCFSIEDVVKDKPALPIQIAHLSQHSPLNQSFNPSSHLSPFLTHKTEFTSRTKYAFWILAAIQLPAPIILFVAKMLKKISDDESLTTNEDTTRQNSEENFKEKIPFSFSISYFKSLFTNIHVLQLTLLISLLVFLFEGLQVRKLNNKFIFQ